MMFAAATPATIVQALVTILSMIAVYHFLLQPMLLDMIRQKLFRLRDEMFLDAADGKISFDDPSYGMLRIMMNRTIRDVAEFHVYKLVAACIVAMMTDRLPNIGKSIDTKFIRCVESMENDPRAEVYASFHQRMFYIMGLHFLVSSVFVSMLLVAVTVLVLAFKYGFGALGAAVSLLVRIGFQAGLSLSAEGYFEDDDCPPQALAHS